MRGKQEMREVKEDIDINGHREGAYVIATVVV
jgi:hypothetical protein